jgi:hypothetical protein
MFKQLIAIFFLVGLLFQHLSRYIVLADYNLNKNSITQNLCENKTRPSMHCNGKCYLVKKMKEAEKKQSPAAQKPTTEIQLFLSNGSIEIAAESGDYRSPQFGRYKLIPTFSPPPAVFRPPVA